MDAVPIAQLPQEGMSPVRAAEAPAPFDGTDAALLDLGRTLKELGYRFVTVTPASHARVLARPAEQPASLSDVFGWSRPFRLQDIDPRVARHASAAGVLKSRGGWMRSSVRFSTFNDQLYVHSAYPTEQADAVFFGPDTYRFFRVINTAIAEMARSHRNRDFRILDVGAGSGAGGLHAASRAAPTRPRLTLSDINRRALRYCRINAALNGIGDVRIVESDLFQDVGDCYDLIIANPPYLVDKLARTYRHGGGPLGSALSLRIVTESLPHLAPGGRLVLYTGSAIVKGYDYFKESVSSWMRGRALHMTYEEIDPDVFGEELDQPPYDSADRIAAVSVTIDMPRR
jgi:release factor glutamine methyltransferase